MKQWLAWSLFLATGSSFPYLGLPEWVSVGKDVPRPAETRCAMEGWHPKWGSSYLSRRSRDDVGKEGMKSLHILRSQEGQMPTVSDSAASE